MMPTGAVSTASDPIDPELVDRFRAALDRLNPQGGRIGLAVSGGPDSMAMLLLAHAAIPREFEVATVDHGLRPEAKDECALVVAACEERGISCEVLTVKVGEGNVQAMARSARYNALVLWAMRQNLAVVATAHHADDQAETLLMRLNRGSGVRGLAGIRAHVRMAGSEMRAIRPLLQIGRSELRDVVLAAGLTCAADPSNEDDNFDRVRIRKALSQMDWLDPLALARTASIMADCEAVLLTYAALYWPKLVTREGDTFRLQPTNLREVRLRFACEAIQLLGGNARKGEVAQLLERIDRGEPGGNIGGVLVTRDNEELIFSPEPPRKTG